MAGQGRCTKRVNVGLGMHERCALPGRHKGDCDPEEPRAEPRARRAILPATPVEERPDMAEVEARIRAQGARQGARYRKAAPSGKHPSAFLEALAAPLVDKDAPDYRPEDWR